MSPADERRRLVRQAQMLPVVDHTRSSADAWFGDSRPNLRSSLYPAEAKPTSPRRRGLAFAGVSFGLIAAALGVCWLLAGSDGTTVAEHTQTAEITGASLAAPGSAKPVAVGALPNAPSAPNAAANDTAPVPMTVQPAQAAMIPAGSPQSLAAAAPPAPPTPPAAIAPTPPLAASPARVAAVAPTPVRSLPAAAPRRPMPHDTLHVVMTPAPEPDESDSTSASTTTSSTDTREAPSE